MPRYTFKLSNLEYRTVDALDLDNGDSHEFVEGDDFDDRCFMSLIADEILFGQQPATGHGTSGAGEDKQC